MDITEFGGEESIFINSELDKLSARICKTVGYQTLEGFDRGLIAQWLDQWILPG
ncbi:hypothetical protein PJL18_00347 [Paenarthrobacter nicotinovorans]|nr:hypothetical protein [Paenarthrobacter nicotinovorans]